MTTSAAPIVFFLPALDEGERIGGVLARMPEAVDGHPVIPIVIDDGSTDDTAAVAEAAGAEVVSFASNRGLGAAVRHGLRLGADRGAVAVAFCDADGEYDPQELPALVAPILTGKADYVVGSRFLGGPRDMRIHREVGNRALTFWVRTISGLALTDGQSGFRVLSGAAAAEAEVIHDYNYAQPLTLDLVGKGFRYAEVPITYRFRSAGQSFVQPYAYLRHVVPAVWRQTRFNRLRRR